MSPDEQAWARDKARFRADTVARDHGAPLGPLAQQFATLTYSLLDADTVADVLAQVAHAALNVIAGADLASVTLRSPDGRFHTPVYTDKVAIALDHLQYRLTEGPCLDAAQVLGPACAISPDLAADTRWPRFGPAAADHGVGAVLSTALLPSAQPPQLSGSLNLYSRRPHGLDDADASAALLLATHASLALAHTRAVSWARLQENQLREAIDSRDVIGQAKGILMARRGMSANHAFDVLRRASQDLNVKLVKIAETLASRHTELDLPDH